MKSRSGEVRFILGFAIQFVIIFGALGYAIYLLAKGDLVATSLMIVGILALARFLPPVLVRLVMLGYSRPEAER